MEFKKILEKKLNESVNIKSWTIKGDKLWLIPDTIEADFAKKLIEKTFKDYDPKISIDKNGSVIINLDMIFNFFIHETGITFL